MGGVFGPVPHLNTILKGLFPENKTIKHKGND